MSQGIEFNRLMLDMRAMQMDAMAKPKAIEAPEQTGATSFSDMLGMAVNKVNDTQQASNRVNFLSQQAKDLEQQIAALSSRFKNR